MSTLFKPYVKFRTLICEHVINWIFFHKYAYMYEYNFGLKIKNVQLNKYGIDQLCLFLVACLAL